MSLGAQRGQATVEAVGVAVMVALLLAATTAWLLREVRPPGEPPAVIEAAARPLARDPWPLELRYPLPPAPFDIPRGRDDEPIGRALRILARGAGEGVVVAAEMRQAFARAYAERLLERGREFLEDPLTELPDPELLTPEGAVGAGLRNAEALWEYARELRSLPLREAALRASADAGALAADLTISGAKRAARRKVEQVGRDRASRGP
jgi:hypothetical protein